MIDNFRYLPYGNQETNWQKGADMEIGKKLKSVRLQKGFTQEAVAEKVQVSRQTISNWENEKSYPDIVSVVNLSNLYEISLDELLKEDKRMLEHLEESTNIVRSNKRLVTAVIINIVLLFVLMLLSSIVPNKTAFLVIVFVLAIGPTQQFMKSMVDIIKLFKFYYKIISPKSLLRVRNG